MSRIRTLISITILTLLVLGYAASQLAALQGTAEQYAQKVDCPQVQYLALAFLLVCIVLAFIGDKEADEK